MPSNKDKLLPIYVASRASLPERGAMWRAFRDNGVPITSSWIDEDGEGQTVDYTELWSRIADEIARANVLVLYAETGDFPLKGAFIEAGIAIGMGKHVIVCLPDVDVAARSCRPIGSWINHPLVSRVDDIDGAVKIASSFTFPTRADSDSSAQGLEQAIEIVKNAAEQYRGELKADGSSFSVMKREVCFKLLRDLRAALIPVSTAPDRHAGYCALDPNHIGDCAAVAEMPFPEMVKTITAHKFETALANPGAVRDVCQFCPLGKEHPIHSAPPAQPVPDGGQGEAEVPAEQYGDKERCHSDSDGDCVHENCPQLRDNEPEATGRHCPLDTWRDPER